VEVSEVAVGVLDVEVGAGALDVEVGAGALDVEVGAGVVDEGVGVEDLDVVSEGVTLDEAGSVAFGVDEGDDEDSLPCLGMQRLLSERFLR